MELCSAIRHLIMQQNAIAQFLQVSGPALTPAGTKSFWSSTNFVPLQHLRTETLSARLRRARLPARCTPCPGAVGSAAAPCMAQTARCCSRAHPDTGDRDPLPSHCPAHGEGEAHRGEAAEHGAPRTWYSSAIPASRLSGSSATSSAEPFWPSWELLPEIVLLLCDESRESSSVRSMVVRTGMADRLLELCTGERGVSTRGERGERSRREQVPRLPLPTSHPPNPCSQGLESKEQGHCCGWAWMGGEGPGPGTSTGVLLSFVGHRQQGNSCSLPFSPQVIPSSQSTQNNAEASSSTHTHCLGGKLRHGAAAMCPVSLPTTHSRSTHHQSPGKPLPCRALTRSGVGRSLRFSSLFASLIFISCRVCPAWKMRRTGGFCLRLLSQPALPRGRVCKQKQRGVWHGRL